MLLTAHLGLSYACNMSCQHCFVKKRENSSYVENHYPEIINSIKALGGMLLIYTYGEPLMSSIFFDAAQYAQTQQLYQILMTNGYFIQSDDIALKIKQCGIRKVFISMDSINAQVHDRRRGKSGAWDKAVNALKLLRAHIKIGVACTIGDYNVHEMISLFEFAQENNIDEISFLRLRDSSGISKFTPENDKKYITNIIKILTLKREGVFFHDLNLKTIINSLYQDSVLNDLERERFIDMNECHMSTTICIAPNGDISRCTLTNDPIGSLHRMSLSEAIKLPIKTSPCIAK